jgi:hypothetical protein
VISSYPRRQRDLARPVDGVHTSRVTFAALGVTDDFAMLSASPRACSGGRLLLEPRRARPQHPGAVESLGLAFPATPIVLVRIGGVDGLPLVRQVLLAQEYWRVQGLRADVVILNEHAADYLDELQAQLTALVAESRWAAWKEPGGGSFCARKAWPGGPRSFPPPPRVLLDDLARWIFRWRGPRPGCSKRTRVAARRSSRHRPTRRSNHVSSSAMVRRVHARRP